MINVLCVCLGNICRSPLAEGILQSLVQQRGLEQKISVDSAGTNGFHDGELADHRSRKTAKAHGIELTSRSRQITDQDFSNFDYLLVMDDSNRSNVLRMAPKGIDLPQIFKIREFDNARSGDDVQDPYYGGQEGFEIAYRLLLESCDNFLEHLIKEHDLSN